MSEVFSALLGFAPGAFGGICNVFVGHPIDLVKVRQQTITHSTSNVSTALKPSSSTFITLRNIMYAQGITGLYAGVSAPLVAVVPAFAVSFATYDFAKMQIIKNKQQQQFNHTGSSSKQQLTIKETAAAGAFSGIFIGIVLGPLERIKCLLQATTRYKNMNDCVRQIYATGGIRSIFKGTFLTILRDVPGNAAYFATYEGVKRYSSIDNSYAANLMVTIAAGGLAGIANWLVVIPIDVIKSRWQTLSDAQTLQYKHWTYMTRDLVRQHGFGILVQGLRPALLRAFPANAACLVGVEAMRKVVGIDV